MWYLILGFLALIYLLLHTLIPSQGFVGFYVLGPFLWIILAILSILLAQKDNLSILKFTRVRRWYLGNSPVHAGLLIGGFQISVLIIVGLFAGFGNSPYSFTPLSILINILFVSSLLIGTEVSRAYLIKKGARSKRHTTLMLGLITLLYVAIQLTPNKITELTIGNTPLILEFLGITLITSIAMNLLASYLSYVGGATASLSYVGTLFAFEWFSPILPVPHWTILALIGTIVPAIGFLMIQSSIREPGQRKQRFHRKKSRELSWTAVAIFSVIMVFFSSGFLGVKPTVIYSGSMSPALEVGDIALVQKVDIATIKPGDVIQFLQENVTILHRVVRITETEGKTLYITQGDANDDPDSQPVPPNYILGKSVFTIPKLGWVQIFIKDIMRQIGVHA
ncbi:MAG: signal peptidase I [Thermoplasmata archaeon]|nr:signal peptidase I [Thermoplasmata archaeon]